MTRTTRLVYPFALAVGAGLAGAAFGVLFAPHSGRRTRRHLRKLPQDVQHQLEDWYEELEECIDDFKLRLDETLVQGRKTTESLRTDLTEKLDSGRETLARRVQQVRESCCE